MTTGRINQVTILAALPKQAVVITLHPEGDTIKETAAAVSSLMDPIANPTVSRKHAAKHPTELPGLHIAPTMEA